MNAAEITDKLGLHSLRQRAWVGSSAPKPDRPADNISISNLLALPPVTVSTKAWNGSATRCARLVTTKHHSPRSRRLRSKCIQRDSSSSPSTYHGPSRQVRVHKRRQSTAAMHPAPNNVIFLQRERLRKLSGILGSLVGVLS
jgi:hypothetical protein